MDHTKSDQKIIVIAPVKDEEWILERFLWACSQFADHIILLNQQSTDRTVEIIGDFEKAMVFNNPSPVYDEAYRTEFLVGKVRELYGLGNLIIALDADEIPTYPSLNIRLWESLKRQPLGTTIVFSKPDLLSQPMRYLPAPTNFPLAYVDDGADTEKKLIHNRRIPGTASGPQYVCSSIIVLHFARVRQSEYFARQAMYCVIENVNRSKNLRLRTLYYSRQSFLKKDREAGVVVPDEWSRGYLEQGIDLYGYRTDPYNEFHRKVLEHFEEHGTKRFWMDDIWWEDWQAAAAYFCKAKKMNNSRLALPNASFNACRGIFVSCSFMLSAMRASLRKLMS
ncbi:MULTISPECIES: glycosyltransferase family 2 protein [unclassified Lentimonas]|uniref:glycosyltransferase family 2 protein n=1 Tax=unclassified Lentimonas TaxID=2630993 RepID=UPI001320C00A|nr:MULTISPECIES: glycosyltransferase family 2 protein [unclassified Lentimonas]CAA6693603.1 Unannotated [Lentimonas sp. CC10]CAA6696854.1 Unannotated [Lentimonas sp. CC19]CAA7071182.1 Unannotated [Lentimonas sp. CC11]